ncbi:phosphomannomutase [Solibacillus sp. FSL K6-1554]|uniref:phosphomannomutase n=1 Tax=Solibacillus sp. FSL K6-1554 TaxID=2921472 RepID=UPI0030F66894
MGGFLLGKSIGIAVRRILLERSISLLEKENDILGELQALFKQVAFILELSGNILESWLLIRTNKNILDNF